MTQDLMASLRALELARDQLLEELRAAKSERDIAREELATERRLGQQLAKERDSFQEKYMEASRICDKPGCLAVVIRRDDGGRACGAGHESRWVDKEDHDKTRAMFDTTRHRVLKRLGEEDMGKSWSWIELHVEEMTRTSAALQSLPVVEKKAHDRIVNDLRGRLRQSEVMREHLAASAPQLRGYRHPLAQSLCTLAHAVELGAVCGLAFDWTDGSPPTVNLKMVKPLSFIPLNIHLTNEETHDGSDDQEEEPREEEGDQEDQHEEGDQEDQHEEGPSQEEGDQEGGEEGKHVKGDGFFARRVL